MALEKIELEVPKEMNDVRKFIVQLIVDIKAKKPLADLVAGSLPGLIASVDGYDQLDDEAKTKEAFNLYGLLASDMAKALSGKG
jgi:hypothetical protein